jgi:hypothetical protein
MEVMAAVQSGTLLRALRVQLKRRVSARRGGDYNEVTAYFIVPLSQTQTQVNPHGIKAINT